MALAQSPMRLPPLRLPPPALLVALAVGALAALAMTCARIQNPNAAKYPPRGRSCSVRVYNTPAPGVKEWDDLGVAHVDCPLDLGRVQCLRRLREEACRMGGDLLYDVPKRPARPTEQGMVYVGHVAHTRAGDAAPAEDDTANAEEEPAFDTKSPIEPLGATPAAAIDAGARDGARD